MGGGGASGPLVCGAGCACAASAVTISGVARRSETIRMELASLALCGPRRHRMPGQHATESPNKVSIPLPRRPCDSAASVPGEGALAVQVIPAVARFGRPRYLLRRAYLRS